MSKKAKVIEEVFKTVILNWEQEKQDDFLKVLPIFQFNDKIIDLWIELYKTNNDDETKKRGEKRRSLRKSTSIIIDNMEKYKTRRKNAINFIERAVSKQYIKLSQVELAKLKEIINKYNINSDTINIINFYTNKNDYDLTKVPPLKLQLDEIIQLEDLNPSNVASQITFEVMTIMDNINTHELINSSIIEDYDDELCPNIKKLSQIFNTYGYWVPTEVLIQAKTKEQRIKLIEKFIDICDELKKLKNYYIFFAIMGGLNNIAVQRLKCLWKPETDYKKKFIELDDVLSPLHNYANYRREIGKVKTEPIIPYIGIISSTIKHIYELDFITKKNEFNWKIYDNILKVVKTFESYNKIYDVSYDNHMLSNYLRNLNVTFDDNIFWEQSKKIQENISGDSPSNNVSESLNLLRNMDNRPMLVRRSSDDAISSRRVSENTLSTRTQRARSLTLSLDETRKNQIVRGGTTDRKEDRISSMNPPIPSQMPMTPRSLSMTFHDKKLDCIITINKKPDPSYKDVNIEDWTIEQVVEWLNVIGLGEYKNNFINEKITGFELVELPNVDFKALNEIGVDKVGDKLKILRNIRLEIEKNK